MSNPLNLRRGGGLSRPVDLSNDQLNCVSSFMRELRDLCSKHNLHIFGATIAPGDGTSFAHNINMGENKNRISGDIMFNGHLQELRIAGNREATISESLDIPSPRKKISYLE